MNNTVKNSCTVQTEEGFTLIDSEISTDCIKEEPTDLDDYKILDLEEESVIKESLVSPNEFKLEVEYDDKTIKIKKEIFEDTFENYENHKISIEERVLIASKSYLTNSAQSILDELVDCKKVNKNESKKCNYICDLCHQSFNKKKILVIHMKHHYSNDFFLKKVFKNVCSTSVKCVRPKRIRDKKNSFECERCLKRFTDYSNCRRHIQNHCINKQITEKAKHICDICMKLFTTAYGLKVHKRIHYNDKPFKCNFCQSTFYRKDSLQIHERTHIANRSNSAICCDKCHKTFSSNSCLRRHTKMHMNKNYYQCDYCKCLLYRKDSLIVHIRSKHTGERPYQCHLCEKSFFEKKVLLSHMKIH